MGIALQKYSPYTVYFITYTVSKLPLPFLLVIHFTFCTYVSFKTVLSYDTNFQKQHSVMTIKNFSLFYSYIMISGFSQDNQMSFISNHKDK